MPATPTPDIWMTRFAITGLAWRARLDSIRLSRSMNALAVSREGYIAFTGQYAGTAFVSSFFNFGADSAGGGEYATILGAPASQGNGIVYSPDSTSVFVVGQEQLHGDSAAHPFIWRLSYNDQNFAFSAASPQNVTFNTNVTGIEDQFQNTGTAFSKVAIQQDGKLFVLGTDPTVTKPYGMVMARLNRDGTTDTTFNGGTKFAYFSPNAFVRDASVTPSGHLLTLQTLWAGSHEYVGQNEIMGNANAPAAPFQLTGETLDQHSIHISWKPQSSFQTVYEIDYATQPFGPGVQIFKTTAGPAASSATLKGLKEFTTYYIRVKAINVFAPGNFGVSGSSNNVMIQTAGAIVDPVGIDAGSTTGGYAPGGHFFADNSYTGGSSTYDNTPIQGPGGGSTDFYRSRRVGKNFSYDVAVPNGNYTLTLYFYDGVATYPGVRVFDVTAQGKIMLKSFDITKAYGFQHVGSQSQIITVTDGMVHLNFKGITGNATVSGIYIEPYTT